MQFHDGYGYSDISLIPRLSQVRTSDVELTGSITREIASFPLVASPMDSVMSLTLARMLRDKGSVPIIPCVAGSAANGLEMLGLLHSDDHAGPIGALIAPDHIEFGTTRKHVFSRADVVLLDTLHSSPHLHLDAIKAIKDLRPSTQVVSGNVCFGDDALRVIEAGADGVRVGMSAASINNGYAATGCGRLQASAVLDCASAASGSAVPIIADGGIKSIGQAVIALALGASSVMAGSMFAAIRESAAPYVEGDHNTKHYRGMSRPGLIDSDMRPEALDLEIPVAGDFEHVFAAWTDQLRIGISRAGCSSISTLQSHAVFERRQSGFGVPF